MGGDDERGSEDQQRERRIDGAGHQFMALIHLLVDYILVWLYLYIFKRRR